ncbi:hypothetical protein [Celerinatantimonas sp. YJH-8]|uniref:hypothetical protein n=1 Tax=Celerinatantimonas sp. YJH-8 TaxID=3228714 RepID=UPI0038C739E3
MKDLTKEGNGPGVIFSGFIAAFLESIPDLKSSEDFFRKIMMILTNSTNITLDQQLFRKLRAKDYQYVEQKFTDKLANFYQENNIKNPDLDCSNRPLANWELIAHYLKFYQETLSIFKKCPLILSRAQKFYAFLNFHFQHEEFLLKQISETRMDQKLFENLQEKIFKTSDTKKCKENVSVRIFCYWAALFSLRHKYIFKQSFHLEESLPCLGKKGRLITTNERFIVNTRHKYLTEAGEKSNNAALYKKIRRAQMQDKEYHSRHPQEPLITNKNDVRLIDPDTSTIKKQFQRLKLFSFAKFDDYFLTLERASGKRVFTSCITVIFLNMFTLIQNEMSSRYSKSPAWICDSFQSYLEMQTLVEHRFNQFCNSGAFDWG